jgi:hypothetical protein
MFQIVVLQGNEWEELTRLNVPGVDLEEFNANKGILHNKEQAEEIIAMLQQYGEGIGKFTMRVRAKGETA